MNDEPAAPTTGGDDGAGQEPLGDGAPQVPRSKKTNYMVLWSRVPQEEEHEWTWRQIGWYEAHSMEGARKAAGADKESGHHGRIADAAQQGPIALQAVAASSWPEPKTSSVEVTTELIIR